MILLLALACGVSEPRSFAMALDPQVPLDKALRACRGVPESDAQGDCLSAALESRGDYSVQDCDRISARRWRNECVFLLAERQRRVGQVAQAVSTCEQSDFARECDFHLIRDQARESVDQDPKAAEGEIAAFAHAQRAPDAANLFWRERGFILVRGHQRPVSVSSCDGLKDILSCRRGLQGARAELLRGVPTRERCARLEAGEPVLQLEDGRASMTLPESELQALLRECAAR